MRGLTTKISKIVDKIFTPSTLNARVQDLLAGNFSRIKIKGEISNLTKHASGHYYFTLKDENAQLRCVMFVRATKILKFSLENAQKVVLYGDLDVYTPRGEYQILVNFAQKLGSGELHERFLETKNRLQNEGLFEKHTKLPVFPKKIALLTSCTGAALFDMLEIAKNRWKMTQILIFDTLMQGVSAPKNICKNLMTADVSGADVIVIARGGGSFEDMFALNDENLARAIFACKTPVVSAIGHESDFVISDFVADLRASTPSNAMELVLPDEKFWALNLADFRDFLENFMQNTLLELKTNLQNLSFSLQKENLNSILENHKNFLTFAREELCKNSLKILNFDSVGQKNALKHEIFLNFSRKNDEILALKNEFLRFFENDFVIFSDQKKRLEEFAPGDKINIFSRTDTHDTEIIAEILEIRKF